MDGHFDQELSWVIGACAIKQNARHGTKFRKYKHATHPYASCPLRPHAESFSSSCIFLHGHDKILLPRGQPTVEAPYDSAPPADVAITLPCSPGGRGSFCVRLPRVSNDSVGGSTYSSDGATPLPASVASPQADYDCHRRCESRWLRLPCLHRS